MASFGLVTVDDFGHWYAPDGMPAHRQPNGKNTTLRHARKQDLCRSVTKLLGVLDKPALNRWRVEQGILSAITLERYDGEPLDDFAKRAAKDSRKPAEEAAAIGNKLHDLAEAWGKHRLGEGPPPDPDKHGEKIGICWLPLEEWLEANITTVEAAEGSFRWGGYGGTIDLVGIHKDYGRVIVDFKSKDPNQKYDPPMKAWPDMLLQQAAYQQPVRERCSGEAPGLMNVLISRNPDLPLVVDHLWPEEGHQEAYLKFSLAALYRWLEDSHFPTGAFDHDAPGDVFRTLDIRSMIA